MWFKKIKFWINITVFECFSYLCVKVKRNYIFLLIHFFLYIIKLYFVLDKKKNSSFYFFFRKCKNWSIKSFYIKTSLQFLKAFKCMNLLLNAISFSTARHLFRNTGFVSCHFYWAFFYWLFDALFNCSFFEIKRIIIINIIVS